ncbi:MAG: BatD family protein [Bdellovibrionaceae bacterium]|nr:BatD family protein [Pseudobdellovibrionaceae bacterium]
MRFLLLLFFPLLTQALQFKYFVDKNEVGLNETFVLTLQFKSNKSIPQQIEVPDIIQLKDFYFLDEFSSQQSSVQIINGKMSRTKTLLKNYRLQPKAIGVFKIPALKVKADDKDLQTQAISITVVKDNSSSSGQAPGSIPNFPFNIPDPFNFPDSIFKGFGNLPDIFSDKSKGDVKLKLELSANSIFKSERLKADWFILSSSSSIHFELLNLPKLKGFWKEKLDIKNPNIGSEIIGNTLYRKQLIDSAWLFPIRSGDLEIDSYSIRQSSFFNSGKVLSFPVRKITVQDLPSEGLDKTFTGAVGDFSIQYLMKKNTGTVNEPLSLKIIFSGSGHPRFIDLPSLSFPPSITVYPPVKKSQFSDRGIGVKEFELIIIPKKAGQVIIPSFSLSTFNPKTNRYISHKSPEFVISVQKGESNNNLGESFLDTPENNKIKTSLFNDTALETFYWPSFINYKNLIKFFLFLFCFTALFLLAIFSRKFLLNREKSLKEKVNNKFVVIQKLLDKKDWQTACIRMIELGTYVLSSSNMQDLLSGWRQALNSLTPNLKEKYYLEFEIMFKKLEALSFSPQSQSSDLALNQAKNLFIKQKNLINKFLHHL